MNRLKSRIKNRLPVMLAAMLQFMPICRTLQTMQAIPTYGIAILLRWVVGGSTMLAYHAVSGASVTITSAATANGTVGNTFSYIITTSTTYSGMLYSASPTPPGVNPLNGGTGKIVSGVPTSPGTTLMTVTVSEPGEPTITKVVTVTISANGPPTILMQPTNQSVLGTSNFVISLTTSNASAFQWYFNSNAISGAVNSNYGVTSAQPTNAGFYFVIISNSLGKATSNPVRIDVNFPPYLTSQPPPSVVGLQSNNTTFNVSVTPLATNVSYQWYFNASTLITGATAPSYTVTGNPYTSAGAYSVVVSNNYGSYTSSPTTLAIAGVFQFRNIVNPGVLKSPVYGPEPSDLTIVKTGNTSLGIPAGGQTYGGVGVTGSNYTAQLWAVLGPNQPASALAPVPGAYGGFTSSAGLFFLAGSQPVVPGAGDGSIATMQLRVWNNQLGTVTNWTQVLASTNVDRGMSPIFNSPPLGGTLPAPALSNLVSFNTSLPPPPPSINTQPLSQILPVGTNVTFSVGATGTTALGYQWQFNGNPVANANGSSLSLTNLQLTNSGNYSVVITNAGGSILSSNAVLSVLIPASVTTQPVSVSVASGTNVTFSVIAAGSPPLSYQWKTNGSAISGATNSSYSLTNVTVVLSGLNFSVLVSNAVGSVLSSNAVLMVTNVTSNAPLVYKGSVQGNLFAISFNSTIGQYYAVEYLTNLNNQNWLTLSNVTAVSTNTVVFDTLLNAAQRYYRVRLSTAPLVLTGKVQANQILLSFNATVGKTYTVQYGTMNGSWSVLTNFLAGATNPVVQDSMTNSSRFYRLQTSVP